MALIADSGAIYALYDARDRHHRAVAQAVDRESGPILIPVAILAEMGYLLRVRLQIHRGSDDRWLSLERFELPDLRRCQKLLGLYSDLDLGLADAAVIATAERLHIRRILTVDERDFRAVLASDGKPFTLLPADA